MLSRRLAAGAGAITGFVCLHQQYATAQTAPTTATHLSSLHRDGYVVIRHAASPEVCASARVAVLDELEKAKRTPEYTFWRRIISPVNKPKHRYELLLRPTPPLEDAVCMVLSGCRSLFTSLVTTEGALVEFGAIISEPGARQQDVHSDIPFSDQTLLYTTFLALQDVDHSLGPTCVFPATHTEEFHRKARRANVEMQTGEDQESLSLSLPRFFDLLTPDWLRIGKAALRPPFDELPVEHMTLCAGDILIYDTRLYHCGGANCATGDDDEAKLRVLLQFSFLAPNPKTGVVDFEGAFVSLAPELEQQQRTLSSFLAHDDGSGLAFVSDA